MGIRKKTREARRWKYVGSGWRGKGEDERFVARADFVFVFIYSFSFYFRQGESV